MNQFIKYVGLDTHKDTIAVAIADTEGGKPFEAGKGRSGSPRLVLDLADAGYHLFATNDQPHVRLMNTRHTVVSNQLV